MAAGTRFSAAKPPKFCFNLEIVSHRVDVPLPDLPALSVAVDAGPVPREAPALPAVEGELALGPEHAAPGE